MEFKDGGHNIQKTKALELTELLKSWLFYIKVVQTSESLGLQLKEMKKQIFLFGQNESFLLR